MAAKPYREITHLRSPFRSAQPLTPADLVESGRAIGGLRDSAQVLYRAVYEKAQNGLLGQQFSILYNASHDISRQAFFDAIEQMIRANFIARCDRRGFYWINPQYFIYTERKR